MPLRYANDLAEPVTMPIGRRARDVRNVLLYRATWGGSQNFLGARWVEQVVRAAPARSRERVALRLLALSPHYFYASDIRAEDARNRISRQTLASAVVGSYLTPGSHVLDYGCGPGYLAGAVARSAAHVDAVDISRGVLACARTLNAGPNIGYWLLEDYRANGHVDVAYSFAVAQHLSTAVLEQALILLSTAMRPGGTLLLHFATAENGYRTEEQCRAGPSLADRMRLRYALNCFARTPAEMTAVVARHGFTDATVRPLRDLVSIPGDDIPDQQLLIARRA